MEHKKKNSCDLVIDQLPSLAPKYPWFVVQNLEKEEISDQIFCTIHKPLFQYRRQIPELLGRQIRGCFHGWMILSGHPDNLMWSLWNPLSSKLIHLPPLQGDFDECCLTGPPDDPNSIFLLASKEKPTLAICCLDCISEEKLRWNEVSYAKQLCSLIGEAVYDDYFLLWPTCFNGKVYALHTNNHSDDHFVLQVDIVVKDDEYVIILLPFVEVPKPSFETTHFLKGTGTELFYVEIDFEDKQEESVSDVCLFKLNASSMTWEEIGDLKDAIFFIELSCDYSIYYKSAIASELGGYIHILDEMGEIMYSYDVKDRTISLSSMPLLLQTSQVLSWALLECRLEDAHGEAKQTIVSKQEEQVKDKEIVVRSDKGSKDGFNRTTDKSSLLSMPLDMLESIADLCVGVDYLNFRATCKRCQLAAPVIPRCNKPTVRRLQTYTSVFPWFMVLDKHRGIITFTDPFSNDKYFIKTPRELIDFQIHSSKYGWLLMYNDGGSMVFFNPFTSDICKLPQAPCMKSCFFSPPPTSSNCIVIGFKENSGEWQVYFHFVAGEPFWCNIDVSSGRRDPFSLCFPTYYSGDLCALCDQGELYFLKKLSGKESYKVLPYAVKAPTSSHKSTTRHFLVKCDQRLLQVITGKFEEPVEVFKLDYFTRKWEKMDDIGKYMIYICDTTCHSVEAKTPEMRNKICFPRLHNKKIVFYSLETCSYHTFGGKNLEDLFGTTHNCNPHAWIEPSWSQALN